MSDEFQKARRGNSLQALEQIYYVIAGLAFTNALGIVFGEPKAGADATQEFPLFFLLFTIGVRFVHGAATHFGLHKIDPTLKPNANLYERVQPLVDFMSFGVQAGIFVALAAHLHEPRRYINWLLTLFAWDTFWIGLTLACDKDIKKGSVEFSTLVQWIWSNMLWSVPLVLVTYEWCFAVSSSAQYCTYIIVGILGFFLDYWLNHKYYFGSS